MTYEEQTEMAAIQAAFMKRRPPEIPSDTLYPSFLCGELIRVRMILRKIESETCVMGYDGGHSGVEALAQEGLRIP